MNTRTNRDTHLSDADESTPMTSVRTDVLDSEDSCIGVVVLPSGAVLGQVLLSASDADSQLPTVHAERGLLGLDPLKDQLINARLGDLLNAMAAAHAAAQEG